MTAHPLGCPISRQAQDFNPFEEAYLQDPPEYLRWAREKEPVFFSPELGYWVVTRYDDIKAIFRDHANFSPANALEKITPPSPAVLDVLASYNYAMGRTLVNEDEPAHMARRRLLLEPFTPEALKQHEPMVRKLCRSYVDKFINDGQADLVEQMLWEVTLTIALHFLGVDEEDMPLLRQYSIAHTVNTWGRPLEQEQLKVAHAVGNFWQLAGKILDKMRQDPSGPGWMKFGIRMQAEHPEVVTDSYLHSMMMAGIVAAHETTANATANALRLLLQHPSAWKEVVQDPSLIPNAVEECLRFSGSIIAWRRIALSGVTVGGIALPAGSKFLMVMTSGNHDEQHFRDADLLDIHRPNAADHLSFGYGAHQCMGKNLARMELQIFIEELSRRLPHMQLKAQQFSYLSNMSFRGPEHLRVQWTPERNPERHRPEVLTQTQAVRLGETSKKRSLLSLRVESIKILCDEVKGIELRSEHAQTLPAWTAGAHIEVECGSAGLFRPYSLCGDPHDRQSWRIAVLKDSKSRGGSAWLHTSLKVGDVLNVRGPRNHFHFNPTTRRVVLIAAGIGITPLIPMALEAKQLGLDYVLHYSGSKRQRMAFLSSLEQQHGEMLQLHISNEGSRADFKQLLASCNSDTQIYACGPQRLLDELEQACQHLPLTALKLEIFQNAVSVLNPLHERSFEIELKDSGLLIQVPPERTVMEALRSVNIDVQSDCGEGLCGSCEVRVLSGTVDHRDKVLTAQERSEHNKMMVCCSRAHSERLVLEL